MSNFGGGSGREQSSHGAHDGHDHRLGHAHHHAPTDFGRAFFIGTVLNVGFIIIEVVFGLMANSTALLADAGHNLSDVLGLLVAWGAHVLSAKPPSGRYTYGYRGTSILAALANSIFLLVAVGAIAWEAVRRFYEPEPVAGGTVMIVAAIGIVINGATAWLLAAGRKSDINVYGAFLHMMVDAGVSAGVVVAGGLILLTGVQWLDPLTSLIIVAFIMWSTWGLLRESVSMSLGAVPRAIDHQQVRTYLNQCPGVSSVHDLHIWPLSTTETALTVHLVMPRGHPGDEFLTTVSRELRIRFGVAHPTIQIEIDEASACELAPENVL